MAVAVEILGDKWAHGPQGSRSHVAGKATRNLVLPQPPLDPVPKDPADCHLDLSSAQSVLDRGPARLLQRLDPQQGNPLTPAFAATALSLAGCLTVVRAIEHHFTVPPVNPQYLPHPVCRR